MPGHVLVVDDNADNRNLLAQFLSDDYRVTEAVNGAEAIACIEAERPDLVLLDLMMPVVDGFGVLAYLHDHAAPFLPVIVVTASTEHELRLRALKAGAHEFIHKPVDDEELFVRIDTLLQLKAARDEAERAARYRSMFLASMSHEIRTPLTAIIGYAELTREPGRTGQEIDEAQRVILQSSKHLLHIINDILDLSKLESGGVEVERMPCRLFDLLGDVESILGSQARQKGLAFLLEPQFPLPETIASDPTRIKQVLLNLCSNALKFTERGAVRLRVSCDREREALQLEVVDSGVGMTPDQLSRLFQPFVQAEATTTRRYGGTGLGLHISRKLAEALGGSLVAESEHGRGSRFLATIATGPLAEARFVTRREDVVYAPSTPEDGQIPDLTGARILLADDTPANQRLIAHFVRQTGASVAVVEDGKRAVEEALGGDYDLVLMDMQMPVMGGAEATALLRRIGFARPIIALTANVMTEDTAAYLRAGCTACLAKPIDRWVFYAELAAHLGGLQADRATLPEADPVLRELAAQFAEELPGELRAIVAARDEADWPRVRALAHRVRGAAGSLGFGEVFELTRRIEEALREDRREEAAEAVEGLAATLKDASS